MVERYPEPIGVQASSYRLPFRSTAQDACELKLPASPPRGQLKVVCGTDTLGVATNTRRSLRVILEACWHGAAVKAMEPAGSFPAWITSAADSAAVPWAARNGHRA